MRFKKRSARLIAGLAVCAIAVAACSSDKEATTTTAGTTAASTGGASTESTTASTGGASTESTTASTGGASTAVGDPDSNHSPTDTAGTPAHGGDLVVGIDSDSANPWAPYRVSCAGSCFAILSAISDPLFTVNQSNEPVPNLVKSFDHNADYTQWTLHLRDGIKFQDGTPLDADAVKFNIDTCRASSLTGSAYAPIATVTASGMDVVMDLQGGPWVALPSYFAGSQCSYMFSKQWLESLSDVPQRNDKTSVYDATLAATPANGDPTKPVGLGAFTFESYSPGNGNSFKATRNEDYWRGKNGITGEDLPYADTYEAVVYVDADSRTNALKSGDIDVLMTANADTMRDALGDKDLKVTTSNRNGEIGYILLNTASGTDDPKGDNAKSPLLQLPCRQALAAAIDVDRYNKERGGDGLVGSANGPFPPGSLGYLEDSGYPKYDVAQAQKYMDQCLQATGTANIEFTFNTTNDPFNVESNQLVISMWQDAFGDKVKTSITPVEQGQYIGLALTGAFQAFGWRNHSGTDPDQQRVWWSSAGVAPIGSLALNFGRFRDDVIDQNLQIIKTNADTAARKAAAEAINKEFGAQVWNIWLSYSESALITRPYVNGTNSNKLADGGNGNGLSGQQRFQPTQLWCDNGKCG
ncbi:MAG: ABC transporter substrate-binding protein [Ilumatobacteraceae bacterium]